MSTPNRLIILILINLIITLITAGCWDRRDLEERVSIVAIAIDKADESEQQEQNHLYKVSIQIPIPIRIAGGGEGGAGGGAESVKVMSDTGISILQALDNLQKRLNQELFLGHVRILVISEEVAKEGLDEIMNGFRRNPQLRRLMWCLITRGEAEAALNIDTDLEQVPVVYLMYMIENGVKLEEIPNISLGDLYVHFSNPSLDAMTHYISIGKNDVSWQGMALFKQDRMVGHLTDRETWLLLQLQNRGKGGNFLILPNPDNQNERLVINPKSLKTKQKLNLDENNITVQYHIRLEIEVIENTTQYALINLDENSKVSSIIAKQLEEEAQHLINKLQHEFGVDALELGLKLKAYHYKYWKKIDWGKMYPETKIDVKYDIKIRRGGIQTQT